ncbi:MAG: NYN domain-containing protein, partial [Clostridia bacterium]|nr:NYN domain-containing protein [Clostridia bacterium]
ELTKNYNVTVATSDGVEQLIIFSSGAYRMPASHLEDEVINVEKNIKNFIEQNKAEIDSEGFLKVLEEKLSKWKSENNED